MRSASLFGFGRFATVTTLALGACAEGREPPPETAMVDITSGLTFVFAERNDFCYAPDTAIDDRASCGEDGGKFALLPPPTQVELEPFAIDVHEVTNLQYLYCVAMGVCSDLLNYSAVTQEQLNYYDTEKFENYPLNHVTYEQAATYCEFVKKRLPTEIEWERVARGNPDEGINRPFPAEGIEEAADCRQGGGFAVLYCGDQNFIPVTSSPFDFVEENGQKIFGMFGNASEWTATWADPTMGCVDEPPCKPQSECIPTDAQCITDSKNCPACTGDECYYMCVGQSRQTIVCTQHTDLPVAQSEILPAGGSTRVVRGGSVSTAPNQPCQLRSGRPNDRAGVIARAVNQHYGGIGFRCAKSL